MMMNRSFWLYLLIIILLYFIWGNVFSDYNAVNQIVFNFAVFYPCGLLAGMNGLPKSRRSVIAAALVFNLFTYLLAYAYALPFNIALMLIDFASMFVILALALYIGARNGKKTEDRQY